MTKEAQAFELGYRVDDAGVLHNPAGDVLKGSLDNRGYRRFKFRKTGPTISVHRLAAYQKFGNAMYEPGIQVRHLDGNALNCAKTNIEIGSPRNNHYDKPLEVRRRFYLAGARSRRKLTAQQADQLRADHGRGMSYKQLVLNYGTSKTAVSYIVTGKTYQGP